MQLAKTTPPVRAGGAANAGLRELRQRARLPTADTRPTAKPPSMARARSTAAVALAALCSLAAADDPRAELPLVRRRSRDRMLR
jgi:hypothetical protein